MKIQAARSRRYLSAIVFTDIVNFSAIVHGDEALGATLLDRHRQLVRRVVPLYSGRRCSTAGDSFLLEFPSVYAAVQAVVRLQQEAGRLRASHPDEAPLWLRASVHLADVQRRGHDLYGDGVNVASRLLPLAAPGGIAISATAYALVRQRLSLPASSVGMPLLKNIATPVEILLLRPEVVDAVPAADLLPLRGSLRRHLPLLTGAGAAAALLTLAAWQPWRPLWPGPPETATAATESRQMIAVLPLRSESPGDDYFSDGLSAQLIDSLSQVKGLQVIGRASAFQFKNHDEDPRAIGRALNVSHLLEGSVQRSGERLRIQAGLVRASDGSRVWSRRYETELKDIFGVQADISRSVAGALKVGAGSEPARQTAQPSNGNLAAYNALLLGSFTFERQGKDDLHKAIAYFNDAVTLDPRYALAHARLSLAWTHLASQYLGGDEADEAYAQAETAAKRALQLDPALAEAYVALGWKKAHTQLNYAAAAPELRRAMELAPGDAVPKNALAYAMACRGNLEQAVKLSREALTIEPLRAGWYFNLAAYELGLHRYDEAENAIRKAIELQPTASGQYEYLSLINVLRGDIEAALRYAREETDPVWRDYALAFVWWARQDREAADDVLQRLIAQHADSLAYQIATIHAYRGEADATFDWLERAYALQDPGLSGLLFDPFLSAHRQDPRFIALAQKIGLPVGGGPMIGS